MVLSKDNISGSIPDIPQMFKIYSYIPLRVLYLFIFKKKISLFYFHIYLQKFIIFYNKSFTWIAELYFFYTYYPYINHIILSLLLTYFGFRIYTEINLNKKFILSQESYLTQDFSPLLVKIYLECEHLWTVKIVSNYFLQYYDLYELEHVVLAAILKKSNECMDMTDLELCVYRITNHCIMVLGLHNTIIEKKHYNIIICLTQDFIIKEMVAELIRLTKIVPKDEQVLRFKKFIKK